MSSDSAVLDELIIGRSSGIDAVRRQIRELVARPPRSVLVLGETGTGKDLVPTALARLSPLLSNEVEVFNCPAIPADHLESELFGTTRGAYPGAVDRAGAAERARGGVLFLDEIGAMDLQHQAKILRLLETGEARRLGASRPYRTDATIVAATNEDLLELAAQGAFREDLYYRLAQDAVIALPPLWQRIEDVPLLAERFVRELSPDRRLDESAVAALCEYEWPGNVRQLRAVVRSSSRLTHGAVTRREVLEALRRIGAPRAAEPPPRESSVPFYSATLAERRQMLVSTLEQCQGNLTLAGLTLGLHRARYSATMPPGVAARKLAHRKFRYWYHRLLPEGTEAEGQASQIRPGGRA
jgi:DNA-binding NtrC family response regulator